MKLSGVLLLLICQAVADAQTGVTLTTLHSFNGSFNGTNGAYPCSYGYPSSFLLGSDGNFYGTTEYGGAND